MHNKRMMGLAFCIAAFAMIAAAQTNVQTSGTTTSGTIPVFGPSSNTTVTNSPITVSGGNIGIGTTNPLAALQIGTYQDTTTHLALVFPAWDSTPSTGGYAYVVGGWNASGYWGIGPLNGSATPTLQIGNVMSSGNQYSGLWSPTQNLNLVVGGNVGIGTTNPLYTLDVTGTIRATTGVVFPDGTTQVTAFLPANCGADYAEAVDVSGDRTKYEPGDVLVIDPSAPGKFLKANQAYSTLVAGIYSTKPGFVGRLAPADPKTNEKEVPMAMVGRVPTKVSAENGPIKVGDLLVASSRMGYAMKGTDRSQMLGAVVGKALGSLDSGTGVIEVLVTLQ